MTNIELQTMELVKSACKEYVRNSEKIDWEQRRYEIAKQVLPTLAVTKFYCGRYGTHKEIAEDAVKYADALIEELEK